MASIIYLYSKFTDEMLLFLATGFFAVFAIYGYAWINNRKKYGSGRDLVPASVVKTYLNQMIGEAQFMRTQLFGLLGGEAPSTQASGGMGQLSADNMDKILEALKNHKGSSAADEGTDDHVTSISGDAADPDLIKRLKALESQIAEKDTLIQSFKEEQSKLVDQIQNVQAGAAGGASAQAVPSGGADLDDMLNKIKSLEERLEEYSVIEEDLVNLKRLQEENKSLKQKLDSGDEPQEPSVTKQDTSVADVQTGKLDSVTQDDSGFSSGGSVVADTTTVSKETAAENEKASPIDQHALDAFLSGEPPIPPPESEKKKDTADATTEASAPVAEEKSKRPALRAVEDLPPDDAPDADFANLDSTVSKSIQSQTEGDEIAATIEAASPSEPNLAEPALEKATEEPVEAAAQTEEEKKTDEELLKEFEKLLSS